ncbi:MAG: NAD-dependent DNA ligase LigA [Pirellulaceae bacterium]|nr:NAD-dependent DNA ligase LigA [Pirellulaceae bacterium]
MSDDQLDRLIDDAQKLRNLIRKHDQKYYVEAEPVITDYQYDRLVIQLKRLEAQLVTLGETIPSTSPTQRVGDKPLPHLLHKKHRLPMLSIENTYSVEELLEFEQRTKKTLEGEKIEWVVELKIDGAAVSLTYEKGKFVQALSRGDGAEGDDITHTIRTIAEIPLELFGKGYPDLFEVRGEVYMTNSSLVEINEEIKEENLTIAQENLLLIEQGKRPKKEKSLKANTRNLVAGTIRKLDPSEAAQRELHLFCHGIGFSEPLPAEGYFSYYQKLKKWGLPTLPTTRRFSTMAEVLVHCDDLLESLHDLDYEVDGIVVKVDRFSQQATLGTTNKSPKWLVAYKVEKYEATTQIEDIYVQVGKTGAITPVARLAPVTLAGSVVSRTSLHNAEEIKRKDIRIGDTIVIEKAGKVIPHVVRVEKHLRSGNEDEYLFPTICPECQAKLVQDSGGVYIRCPNFDCQAQLTERLSYFSSRSGMDIDGLNIKTIEMLLKQGLIQNISDLYRLTKNSFQDLIGKKRSGFKETSANNLLAAIEASKQRGLGRLLGALSIRHVGSKTARLVANSYPTLEKLQGATQEEFNDIDGVGEIIAESLYDYLHSDYGKNLLNDLEKLGVSVEEEGVITPEFENLPFVGKRFVVTGTLAQWTRKEAQDLIEAGGGKCSSSLSSKTDYLLAGEGGGSKLEKATALGTTILSEAEFKNLLKPLGKQKESLGSQGAKNSQSHQTGTDSEGPSSQGSLF